MWKSTVEAERSQMTIWHMRIAYWIPKVINTRSEYSVLIVVFTLYMYCLSCFSLVTNEG
jgi:hypothetical protein